LIHARLDAGAVTLAAHLAELYRLREDAGARGKYAAAVRAECARGKAAGLYVHRTEITTRARRKCVDDMTDAELEAEIARLAPAGATR